VYLIALYINVDEMLSGLSAKETLRFKGPRGPALLLHAPCSGVAVLFACRRPSQTLIQPHAEANVDAIAIVAILRLVGEVLISAA
jgi:hypothetical protein